VVILSHLVLDFFEPNWSLISQIITLRSNAPKNNFIVTGTVNPMDKVKLGFRANAEINASNHLTASKLESAIGYTIQNMDIMTRSSHTFLTDNVTHAFGLSFFQKLSDKENLALDVERDFSTDVTTLKLGVSVRVDAENTFKTRAVVKHHPTEKADPRFGFVISRRTNANIDCVFSADLGLRNLLGDDKADGHFIGLDLNIK